MGAQGLVIVTWERKGCERSRHPRPSPQARPSPGLGLLMALLFLLYLRPR